MNRKIPLLIGHVGFLMLIAISVLLANERSIFMDSAVQIFEMIQCDWYAVYDHRYTMVITQTLPLICIKLHLPLQVIIVSYSAAAPLLAYSIYILITYILHDVRLGLTLLLPLLCMRHTFFHAISESFSLMVYAILLAALLLHCPKKEAGFIRHILHSLCVALATAAAVFIHPIGMFFVVYLVGYFLVYKRLRPNMQLIVASSVLVACVIIRSLSISGHDSDYIPTLSDALFAITHPNEMKVVIGFANRLADLYIYPIVLYIVVAVYYIRRREWVRLTYSVLFNVCFIIMTAIVYRSDNSAVCIERAWMPLIFFAAIPFVCEVTPNTSLRGKYIWLFLMSVALLMGFIKIVDTSKHYRQRINKIKEITEVANRKGIHKMVTSQDDIQGVFDINSWCTSFESMLISALQGSERTINIYIEDEPLLLNNPDYMVTDAFLAVPWWRLWNNSTLRTQWFHLPKQPFARLYFNDGTPVIERIKAD
ncbi:MAG: hypothetical protein J6I49_02970 [Bacteroidales bacterium]|nr:hypothetical protein [Bacteroidales bacterium]